MNCFMCKSVPAEKDIGGILFCPDCAGQVETKLDEKRAQGETVSIRKIVVELVGKEEDKRKNVMVSPALAIALGGTDHLTRRITWAAEFTQIFTAEAEARVKEIFPPDYLGWFASIFKYKQLPQECGGSPSLCFGLVQSEVENQRLSNFTKDEIVKLGKNFQLLKPIDQIALCGIITKIKKGLGMSVVKPNESRRLCDDEVIVEGDWSEIDGNAIEISKRFIGETATKFFDVHKRNVFRSVDET